MMHALDMTSTYMYLTQRAGLAWMENAANLLDLALAPQHAALSAPPEGHDKDGSLGTLKQELISTISHELRTPLTSIRTFSEILHDNPDLEAVQRSQFLEIILKESDKLTGVVNQTLELAEIEAGTVRWNLAEINLKEVIDEALATVRPLLEQKRVQFQLRLPDQVPPIFADRRRITQVIINLLSNAIQFCDSTAGWVGIRLRIIEDHLQVEVSDNGPGLRSPSQDRSSKGCGQVEDTQAEEPQITNMNFLISRYIVARSGGKMWAERSTNYGAKLIFTLPCKANAA